MKFSWLVALGFGAVLAAGTQLAHAQCYLSQGCKPVDYLNYQPSATGQVFHGDGASYNGAGGWTTDYADVNQSLSCHFGSDTLPYLMTGHKNTLRKVAPGIVWRGPDRAAYAATDDFFGSGSTFDWNNQRVTIGWCTPLLTTLQNGLDSPDAECRYPYYTLPNSHAPAPYAPVAPTVAAGGVRSLFYLYGGWSNYSANSPSATELNTIFDHGFTGDLYPNGNFDCARCHATGYAFDNSAPEPTQNTTKLTYITDAQFPRVPSDGYVAPGTTGTSSWFLTGVQCERCHVAANNSGTHPYGRVRPTIKHYEAATALCMECHRSENIVRGNPAENITGSITPSNSLVAVDHGYCSDASGATYATCIQNPSNQWIYKPYVNHEAGQAFLNSPHARFTGSILQNAQHSADLSITISGTYASQFSPVKGDLSRNKGCTGCHDPHQSTVPAAMGTPIIARCDQCHKLAQTILSTVNHPTGPGTPFQSGTTGDIPGACVICHMQGANGHANSHLFRINPDPAFRTFPTPEQFYDQNITTLGVAPEFSPLDETTFNDANWLDVDLACGQCHIGGDGVTNPYGLTVPPGTGARSFTRAELASWAGTMHPPDPGVPAPTFSPQAGTYNTPQTVTISETMSGSTIYYTIDGTLPTTGSAVYSAPIPVATSMTLRAFATHAGFPRSPIVSATYSLVLPTAPAPAFSPLPSTYSAALSVTLSNTAQLPMFYTTDGSMPTTASTPYSGPISVNQNTVIKAITAAYGYLTSMVSTGGYNIQAPAPKFTPAAGTYSVPQTVTISDTVAAATLYYTTNGSTPTTSSTACANPCTVTISATTTLKATAAGGGYAQSTITAGTYTIAAAAPVFSPAPGTFYAPQTVTITDTTAGVLIYYTTNNTLPTLTSPSCASPCTVAISGTSTLRAMAAGSGISQSGTTVGVYTIAVRTPTFSPGSGTYTGAQTVTISDATSGSTIYYTTNGATPTTGSTPCSNPCTITVATTSTVKAIATAPGLTQSSVGLATYTIR